MSTATNRTGNTVKRLAIPFLWVLILTLSVACADEAPEVLRVSSRLILFDDREHGLVYETLSVFADLRNQGGFDRIRSFYLVHDREGFVWSLEPETWHHHANGQDQVGYPRFVMPDRSAFPRGEYRVVVTSVSGETGERSFYLNVTEWFGDFPAMEVTGLPHSPVLESGFESVSIYFMGRDHSVLSRYNLESGPIDPVWITPETGYLMLHAEIPDSEFGFISGPYLW